MGTLRKEWNGDGLENVRNQQVAGCDCKELRERHRPRSVQAYPKSTMRITEAPAHCPDCPFCRGNEHLTPRPTFIHPVGAPEWIQNGFLEASRVSKPSFDIEAVLGMLLNAIGGPLPPPLRSSENHEHQVEN